MSLFEPRGKDMGETLLRKQVGLGRFIYNLLEAQREAFIVDSQAGWTPRDTSQGSCAAKH